MSAPTRGSPDDDPDELRRQLAQLERETAELEEQYRDHRERDHGEGGGAG